MQKNSTGVLIADLVDTFFRHKISIAFIVFVAMLAAAVVAILQPSLYQAHASLLLTFGREYVYRSEVGDEVDSQLLTRPSEVINSEVQIVSSRDLRIKLIDEIGADTIYPELAPVLDTATGPLAWLSRLQAQTRAVLDQLKRDLGDSLRSAAGQAMPADADPTEKLNVNALKLLEENMRVERAKEANVIHIYYTNPDREVTREVVTRFLSLLADKRRDIYGDSQLPFFEEQLIQYRRSFAKAEQELQALKERYRVYNPDEQTRLVLGQIVEHEKSLMASLNSETELEEQIAELITQMGLMPENVPLYLGLNTEPIRQAVKRLQDLRYQEAGLLARAADGGGDASDELDAVLQEIDALKQKLDNQKKDLGSRVRSGKSDLFKTIEVEFYRLKASLTAFRARSKVQQQQLSSLQEQLHLIDLRRIEIEKLQRDMLFLQRNIDAAATKLEEERLSEQLDQLQSSNIRTIQEPIVTKLTQLPKILRVLLGGLFGLVAGLGLALYRDYRRGAFFSQEKLEERFGVPVLASIAKR